MASLFSLEALEAKAGDCLLLHFGSADDRHVVLVDGGPSGVYPDTLRPRLAELRGAGDPLALPLIVVSHVDDDHILGIIELLGEVRDTTGHPDALVTAEALWHNAVAEAPDDLVQRTAQLDPVASAVVASYRNGRELDRLAGTMPIARNAGFDEMVAAQAPGADPIALGELKLRVVAPNEERLAALEARWREALDQGRPADEVQSFADPSVTNRASIVVLVEYEGRQMLLTGDARGDDLRDCLRDAGLAWTPDAPLDVLKVPHHGSDRNVKPETFAMLPARHYVISADGLHGNPDVPALRMLVESRDDDDFTLHFTNRRMVDPRHDRDIGAEVAAFLDEQEAAGRRFRVDFRADDEPSIVVDLLDATVRPRPEPPRLPDRAG